MSKTQKLPAEYLGQIEIKKNEMIRRIEEGTLFYNQAMTAWQRIIEGKTSLLVGTSKQIVDYDRSVDDSVKAGNYDLANGDITDTNFPSKEKGECEVEFRLSHFKKTIESDDIIVKMKAEGFRPATMKELLAYGEKNPEVQRDFPIIALGSVAELDGCRLVGCLNRGVSGRNARLGFYNDDWGDGYRFLAVRN